MDNVPYSFRQSVAALLTEPKELSEIESYDFADQLWTEALQTDWRQRKYVVVVIRQMPNSTWKYVFADIYGLDQQNQFKSVDDLIKDPGFKFYRIGKLVVQGPQYRNMAIEDQKLFAITASCKSLLKLIRSMVPPSTDALPVLSISGNFDETTQTMWANCFLKSNFTNLEIDEYTPAYDPILENYLKKASILARCRLSRFDSQSTIWAPSTMAIFRRYFEDCQVFSQLHVHNSASPFAFSDFQAIFNVLLKMEFTSDQLGDYPVYTMLEAYFEEGSKSHLKSFRPDLAHPNNSNSKVDHHLRWKKSEKKDLYIEVHVYTNSNRCEISYRYY
ncbi:hypothetical protein L596_016670 [Steinernema carpocapsae]|uniref:Uncharacterized protein n=1 Tax=Steinernema carpocapsae TaxID=34508 RepID=A0A4U5NJV4_STECR|nr:hypothetical protein L596_016670 [Steinernema carpocapsae]